MKETYITAVLQLFERGKDSSQVLEGLKQTLRKRGHERLYASILRGVARVLEAGSTNTSRVIVASKEGYEKQKAAIEAALQSLGTVEVPEVVVDETIIGGFIAEANDSQLDKSYKSKLVSLYRNLTK